MTNVYFFQATLLPFFLPQEHVATQIIPVAHQYDVLFLRMNNRNW